METMPLTHGRNAREKPGNGTTLAKRQGSPRRSERRSLSISCCILSRWPMATGQALPVLRHLECAVQRCKNLNMLKLKCGENVNMLKLKFVKT